MKHISAVRLGTALALALVARCAPESTGSHSLLDDGECDCFLINGSVPTYYSKHVFFDFRNLTEHAGVPEVMSDAAKSSTAPPTSDYFDSKPWTDVWELQSWDNRGGDGNKLTGDASVLMVNSPNNIYIQKNDDDEPASDTFMTLRTQRLPNFQTAAEFQAKNLDYQFLSLRMLARTTGSPGAVTAMFTYRHSEELAQVQEADIEILTRGPREKIQYTNQPSYTEDGDDRKEATRNATMPGGSLWSDWVVHRLDWTPDRSVWYVDGTETANIEFQTPRDASGVNFNVWSNGGSWSGNMTKHDAAFMQVQWIEMVFNTTDRGNGSGEDARKSKRSTAVAAHVLRRDESGACGVVCSIDETSETGKATMLWEGSSAVTSLRTDLRGSVMVSCILTLAVGTWISIVWTI